MHLIGMMVGGLQDVGRLRELLVHIFRIDHQGIPHGLLAPQRFVKTRLRREPCARGPGDLQLAGRLNRLPRLLGDHADEILLHDHLHQTRHPFHRVVVHTHQRGPYQAGGRTTRPCSIPGTRTLWTNSNWPVAIAAISGRPTGVPQHSPFAGRLAFGAVVESARLNFLPPASCP